jgi:HAD superfamily hydrolase (TIGR01484 family)
MRPLAEMPAEVVAGVRVVLTDIDDTLTTDGRLPADAYAALERLKAAGFAVAPITGRPAGWCDMVARFWPVDGVVGENGALYFAYDHGARTLSRVFAADEATRADNRARLVAIRDRVLAEVAGAAVAADQLYREADLAIDFCEDVEPLPPASVDRIKAIFEEMGAVAKVSSIHVNGWFGDYDKLSMTRRFAAEVLALDIDADRAAVVFCGDSPNDAPMFAHFPNACGVANVRDFAGRMEAEPAFVARSRGGAGFVEIAETLLAAAERKDG